MRYQQLIMDKIEQCKSIITNLNRTAQRGLHNDYLHYQETLVEKLDEINTLVKTSTSGYER